jgi:hypothetical protein
MEWGVVKRNEGMKGEVDAKDTLGDTLGWDAHVSFDE